MIYVITIGLPLLIGAFFVVKRMLSKSYNIGWIDGFNEKLNQSEVTEMNAVEWGELYKSDYGAYLTALTEYTENLRKGLK